MKLLTSELREQQDITSEVTVLTYSLSRDGLVHGRVQLGSTSSGISGGGIYEVNVYIRAGATGRLIFAIRPAVSAGESIRFVDVPGFPALNGETIEVRVRGLAADTAVDIAARLYAVDVINGMDVPMPADRTAASPLDELHLAKSALVNMRRHTVATGVDVILDDDGQTELVTLTPSEQDGVITVTPS